MTTWQWCVLGCSRGWTFAIVHFVEVALVCAGVGLLSLVLRRAPARHRHALWLIVLVKLLLPTVFLGLVGVSPPAASLFAWLRGPGHTESDVSTLTVLTMIGDRSGSQGVLQPLLADLFPWMTLGWLIGMAVCGLRLGMSLRWARGLLKRARPAGPRETQALCRTRAKLGCAPQVRVQISAEIGEPLVAGLLTPVILLPEGLVAQLTDGELETALTHELAHIRRGDQWSGLAQALARVLFWFYPLTWLIDRRLLVERELACDEEVLRAGARREDYLASLWKAMRFGLGQKPIWASRLGGPNLRRRLEMMQRSSRSGQTTWRHRLALGGAVLGAVIASTLAVAATQPAAALQSEVQGLQPSASDSADSSEPVQRVGGDVPQPKKIHNVAPVYPPEAKQAKVEGAVRLETVIGKDGQVRDIKVLEGDSLLTTAAVDAVKQWRYTPSTKDGKPVAVMMTITVNFKLRSKTAS